MVAGTAAISDDPEKSRKARIRVGVFMAVLRMLGEGC
jgi:hypothetical protein